jgi:hypothetical protein
MKNTKWFSFAAAIILLSAFAQAQEPAAVPANLSPGAAEVVKLAGSGSSEDVLLAYVQNSTSMFDLSADQILYLRDLGLSTPVVTAMLNRDSALRSQPQAPTYEQRLYAPTASAPAAPAPVAAPAPETAPAALAAPVPAAPAAPAAAAAPVYVSSPPPEVSYFYNNLTPYGTWIQLDGVGWCWQPTVVTLHHGWQPYCDSGHWVYTDTGWYWQSDYSWGWAPFHYGRWQLHPRCGWVWLPDRVWGPAWVTWRYTGDRCGWAPLPPHAEFDAALGFRFNGVAVGLNFDFGLRPENFTFVAMNDFTRHDLGQRRLALLEVTKIYNHSTIINNYVGNNHTLFNHGIKVEQISAATHTQIRQAAIRDLPAGSVHSTRVEAADKGSPVVYRTQLKAPAKSAPMVAQRVDERHPQVQPTPLTSMRVEHKPAPPTTAPAPAAAARHSQPESPKASTRSIGEKPAAATSAPSTARAYQPAPAAPATPTAPHMVEAPKSPARSTAAPVPQTAPRIDQPAARTEAPASAGKPSSQGLASHVYYPKTYHQAADVHSLPPLSSPSSSHSSSQSSPGKDSKTPSRSE